MSSSSPPPLAFDFASTVGIPCLVFALMLVSARYIIKSCFSLGPSPSCSSSSGALSARLVTLSRKNASWLILAVVLVSLYVVVVLVASFHQYVWSAPTLDDLLVHFSKRDETRPNYEISTEVPSETPAYAPCFALGALPLVTYFSVAISYCAAKLIDRFTSKNVKQQPHNHDMTSVDIHPPSLVHHHHHHHQQQQHQHGQHCQQSSSATPSLSSTITLFCAGFVLAGLTSGVVTVLSLSNYNLLCSYSKREFRTLCDEAHDFIQDVERVLQGEEGRIFRDVFLPSSKQWTREQHERFERNRNLTPVMIRAKRARVPVFEPDLVLPHRFVKTVVVTAKNGENSSASSTSTSAYAYELSNQTKKIWLHNSNLLASMRPINRDNNFFIKNDHDFDLCLERQFFPKLVQYLRSNRKYYFTYYENNRQIHYTREIPKKIRIYSSRGLTKWYTGHSGTWMIDVDECYYAKEPLREKELGCNGHTEFTLPSLRDSVAHLEAEYPESDWKVPTSYNSYGLCYFFPTL